MIYDNEDYVPDEIKNIIVKEYLIRTYYWAVGFGCFIIGFLLGIIAS